MADVDPLAAAVAAAEVLYTDEVLAVPSPGTCACGASFVHPSRCHWSCCSGESELYCAACLRDHQANQAPLLLTGEVMGDPDVHVRLAIVAEIDRLDAVAAAFQRSNVAAIGSGVAHGLRRALAIVDRYFPDANLVGAKGRETDGLHAVCKADEATEPRVSLRVGRLQGP